MPQDRLQATLMVTAVGAAMPSLHVTELENKPYFEVKGGAPNGKVHWSITATLRSPQ